MKNAGAKIQSATTVPKATRDPPTMVSTLRYYPLQFLISGNIKKPARNPMPRPPCQYILDEKEARE